ncbi:hypothetical protein GGR50DRAFT_685032 [Xylaria sp. CBS 124048]|nr:hypothetical protein GGR50DRAFT_685032 [Xylaria sp. CBS 124048]
MSSGLDSQKLNLVFQSRPDLIQGIRQAADSPSRIKLFNDLVGFVHDQLNSNTESSSEPAQKRRRVDVEPSQNGQSSDGALSSSADNVSSESVLLEIKDISVSIPQRKKFELCFTANHLYARVPGTQIAVPGTIYPWKNIDYCFYLPVPDKSQVQHNYVLLPHNSYFPSQNNNPPVDPLVFTIPATAPKPGSIGGVNAEAASAVSDSYDTLFHWALNKCLQAGGKKVQIVKADPNKFHSVIRQFHRPKEQAVHVKAFRGSKDGFLFFLECGILWGFKKPLLFLPLEKIAAISYTNVLQRTFNMVVEVFTEGGSEDQTEEIEFAMLDQEDYGGINENYVMRHKLQDRSLADQRKAKRQLIENAKVKNETEGEQQEDENGAGEDGMTELQRAQLEAERQLQDEEDEDEEDYDPGSDADSDGSGTSSDDDQEDDEDGADEEEEAEDEAGA